MAAAPTETVHSFWLRFWREQHQGPSVHWRGTVWQEEPQKAAKPIVVTGPDAAFEFVRRALHLPSSAYAGSSSAEETDHDRSAD